MEKEKHSFCIRASLPAQGSHRSQPAPPAQIPPGSPSTPAGLLPLPDHSDTPWPTHCLLTVCFSPPGLKGTRLLPPPSISELSSRVHAWIPGTCARRWHQDGKGATVTDWVLNHAGKVQSTVPRPQGDTEDRASMGHSSLGSQRCPAVGHSASSAFCHACQDDETVSIPTNPGAHCDTGLGQLLCMSKKEPTHWERP